jgi:hypothetical protein
MDGNRLFHIWGDKQLAALSGTLQRLPVLQARGHELIRAKETQSRSATDEGTRTSRRIPQLKFQSQQASGAAYSGR